LTRAESFTIFIFESEDDELRYSVLELVSGQTILSGGIAGRKLLNALIANTPAVVSPTTAYLDFAGIELATASFLRESVVGFRDYARLASPNVYPVVGNLAAAVFEELDFFLRSRADAFWMCTLDETDQVTAACLIGELDSTQRATFDAVAASGAATAPELAARSPEQKIGATAWNNRLSGLAAKGLLVERRLGKTKSFSPLLEFR